MRQLTEEEKLATVMVYTNDILARGELIAKENMRVSIWLRTQGVPNYIHLHKPQVISFTGGTPKTFAFSEVFIPTVQVAAFHLAPPAQEVLDYDASEQNRMMQLMDVMRTLWLSIYDAEIANPHLPQFNMQVPMLLVNSNYVTLGIT